MRSCAMSRGVRTVLAAAMVLLVLGAALAPHSHEGRYGRHGCLACAMAGGDEARSETPRIEPLPALERPRERHQARAPAAGFPLGAVPGQSPPRC